MQPRLWIAALACVLGCAAWAGADERTARAILDRAIVAMGGAKTLAGQRALTGTSRGKARVNEMDFAVTNEWTVQGIDQLKWSSTVTINENETPILLVVNREGGWISGNNQPANPLKKQHLTALRHAFAGLRLAEWLTPLLSKEYTLSDLGELKIDDIPTEGIKVKRKGMPELDIYFDKKSHLPIKAEMRIKESDSQEATYAARFAEYKKFAGRQHFTKLTVYRDDTVVLQMQRSDIKAKEKVDDITFAKP